MFKKIVRLLLIALTTVQFSAAGEASEENFSSAVEKVAILRELGREAGLSEKDVAIEIAKALGGHPRLEDMNRTEKHRLIGCGVAGVALGVGSVKLWDWLNTPRASASVAPIVVPAPALLAVPEPIRYNNNYYELRRRRNGAQFLYCNGHVLARRNAPYEILQHFGIR